MLTAGVEKPTPKSKLMESVFLKACRCEKTPFTPIWLMRQAGRYMKDYRALREKVPFIELCKNKDLASEITVAAQRTIKADAAIIFSDILLLLEPMGMTIEYLKGDGPLVRNALGGAKDIESLRPVAPKESLAFTLEAIRRARRALPGSVPLIGFAGAPFTLASYMIEGGSSRDFAKTRRFMVSDGGVWKLLMDKIADAVAGFLRAQTEAGVQAVQIFDSWVGVLSADEYRRCALPYIERIVGQLEGKTPVIYFGTNTGKFLELVSQTGADVISVDHRVRLDEAWRRIDTSKAIQGNLDPRILCGAVSGIRRHVKRILKEAGGRPGHIFNLGHGVLPETPLENVVALVEMVHEFSRK